VAKKPDVESAGLFNDPGLYRRLSEPFPTVEAGNEAIQGFFRELRELRAKWKLPDVYCVVMGNAVHPNGSEGKFIISAHNGSAAEAEAMIAWAMGYEQSLRQDRIQGAMRGRGFIMRPPTDSDPK
jgi:hypothetical protein